MELYGHAVSALERIFGHRATQKMFRQSLRADVHHLYPIDPPTVSAEK